MSCYKLNTLGPLCLWQCLQIGSTFGHQVTSQLTLSLYLRQPESHQLSLNNLSQLERTGPIDRTPGTPWSDKKMGVAVVCNCVLACQSQIIKQ